METNQTNIKTYNLSEAIELMRNGHLVRGIDWESRVIFDSSYKPYLVFDYIKLLKTHLSKTDEVNNQPYIAKFHYNAGWMPTPYIPTSHEMMAGEFVIIDEKDIKKEMASIPNNETPIEKDSSEKVDSAEFHEFAHEQIPVKSVHNTTCNDSMKSVKDIQFWSNRDTFKLNKEDWMKSKQVMDLIEKNKELVQKQMIKNFDNIEFYYISIIGFISIRKQIEVIGRASYVFISDDFEVNISVIKDENIAKVKNPKLGRLNKIEIIISKSILTNSSDDFLKYLFMWFCFKWFNNNEDKLTDRLTLSYFVSKQEDINLNLIKNELLDFFTDKGKKVITPLQYERIMEFNSKNETYNTKNENKSNISKPINLSPIEEKNLPCSPKINLEIYETTNLSPIEIVLNKFDELSKEDFSVWLDCQRDDLLLLENEYIGNAIKDFNFNK